MRGREREGEGAAKLTLRVPASVETCAVAECAVPSTQPSGG